MLYVLIDKHAAPMDDVQQLARGLESLSHQLGRIFQYMEQQGNGSKEERK